MAPLKASPLVNDYRDVRVNVELVSVKAAKDYRVKIGDMVRISVPNEICHLFDSQTGARIGG